MNVFNEDRKPVMDFDKIRNGTVFTCDKIAYIKGSDSYATNLKTGRVLQPKKEGGVDWTQCTVYNKASLRLF